MRAILPLALAAAVFALGNALADHNWLVALPLAIVVAAGLVLLVPTDPTPKPSSDAPPSASASLAPVAEADGSIGAVE